MVIFLSRIRMLFLTISNVDRGCVGVCFCFVKTNHHCANKLRHSPLSSDNGCWRTAPQETAVRWKYSATSPFKSMTNQEEILSTNPSLHWVLTRTMSYVPRAIMSDGARMCTKWINRTCAIRPSNFCQFCVCATKNPQNWQCCKTHWHNGAPPGVEEPRACVRIQGINPRGIICFLVDM